MNNLKKGQFFYYIQPGNENEDMYHLCVFIECTHATWYPYCKILCYNYTLKGEYIILDENFDKIVTIPSEVVLKVKQP